MEINWNNIKTASGNRGEMSPGINSVSMTIKFKGNKPQ